MNVETIAPTYRQSDAADRRRIQSMIVREMRPQVAALARRVLMPRHWDEGEQVGLIGILVGLEKHDPTSSETFERLAMVEARREIALFERHLSAPLHTNEKLCRAFATALENTPECFTMVEREAVRAVFLECRSLRLAAAHVGVNVNTFKDRIKSARATLRILQGSEGH